VSLKKILFIGFGFFFLGLGVVGLVLPLLPTTPFVLLSAACFSVGSERLDAWLRQNRLFGPYIENYRTKRGISKARKVLTLASLWIGLISSMLLFRTPLLFLVLSLVGIGVTIHILMIKTRT